MEMPRLSNLLQDWWWLAVVVLALWAMECVVECNTVSEIVMGPLLVVGWMTGIFLIDRWVVKPPGPAEPPRSEHR
jgi:hypothetical protein